MWLMSREKSCEDALRCSAVVEGFIGNNDHVIVCSCVFVVTLNISPELSLSNTCHIGIKRSSTGRCIKLYILVLAHLIIM